MGSSVATLEHYSAGAAELAGGVHGALQAELCKPDPEYMYMYRPNIPRVRKYLSLQQPASPPPPIRPPSMEGCLERGVATPTCAVDRHQEQQPRGQRVTVPPPPTTRAGVGRHSRGPQTAPPSAEGDRGGLTSQQQQQQKHPPISVRARHALNLYEQCIRAGQWARVTIEQRDEGESISFFSRPLAAGPATAARRHRKPRRPNKKRVEKRMMWRSSRVARQAAVTNGQQQPAPRQEERQRQQDISSSQQSRRVPAVSQPAVSQQQSASAAGPATPGRSSYAAAVAVAEAATTVTAASPRKPPPAITPTVVAGAAHAAAVQTTASKASQQPVISPKLTRARKKMRCLSDAEAFDQLDGAETSPPPSPDESAFEELDGVATPPLPSTEERSSTEGEPSPSTDETIQPGGPPPPPPWSKFLPSYHGQVICKFCLQRSHGLRFLSCNPCYEKGVLS